MAPLFATPVERLASFFDPTQPRQTYDDAEIHEITNLLHQCAHPGCRSPRTYIILRTIGQLDLLERCLQEGFNDIWFPVEAKGLPNFIKPSIKTKFVQAQQVVLTKSLDLEHGEHRHFTPGELLPFDIVSRLGSGSFGQVDKIVSKVSFRQYALKRIRRRAAFGNDSRQALARFKSEISIIKGLEHDHIIQYVGSYTDKTFLGIVMNPVAETDLATFMHNTAMHVEATWARSGRPPGASVNDVSPAASMSSSLRSYFGCLAAALVYLHDRSIRHKDIKPQNILVHNGTVILTDFGLSHDFADDVGSTTSGPTPASPRYSPPEVAAHEARNTSADIWSLGCVFFEMAAALRGFNIDWVKSYFNSFYSMSPYFHANPGATTHLLREWYAFGPAKDTKPLLWIGSMLQAERMLRPTAAEILDSITSSSNPEDTATSFCGICCLPSYESDSCDSLVDEPPDYSNSARPAAASFRPRFEGSESISYQDDQRVRSSTLSIPHTSDPFWAPIPKFNQILQQPVDSTIWNHTSIPIREAVSDETAHQQNPPPPYADIITNTLRGMQSSGIQSDDIARLNEDDRSRLHEQLYQQYQSLEIQSKALRQQLTAQLNAQNRAEQSQPPPQIESNVSEPPAPGVRSENKKRSVEFLEKLEEEAARQRSITTTKENERLKRLEAESKVNLDDLKKFASRFELHTPVPKDLVSILAKDEEKQKEIVLKALQAQQRYEARLDNST